jgi:hypothetical protein
MKVHAVGPSTTRVFGKEAAGGMAAIKKDDRWPNTIYVVENGLGWQETESTGNRVDRRPNNILRGRN